MSLTEENLKQLREEGYTVVPLLDEETVEQARKGFWSWLSDVTENEAVRSKPETWKTRKWPYCMWEKGIIQWYGVSHAQWVWDLRQDPRVVDVFRTIWGEDDLITSFDGVCVQKPPELTGTYSDPYSEKWQHIDQGAARIGLHTIQGFVDLMGTEPGDGCLVVRPRSHLLHQQFFEAFPGEFKGDWIELEKKHRVWFDEHGCAPIRVTCPVGAMVLWDSRVIHCNSTAQRGRPATSATKCRMVVYICMTPKRFATEATIAKRQKYFAEGRTTNHYPHSVKVFPIVPSFRKNRSYIYSPFIERFKSALQRRIKPELTELGKSLVPM